MDRQSFEDALKRDGYEVATSTTPGDKTNPAHSHPFDVRAMVLEGALTLAWPNREVGFSDWNFTTEFGVLALGIAVAVLAQAIEALRRRADPLGLTAPMRSRPA